MTNGLEVSAVGNLAADIELRFSPSGTPWASFSIAVTERQTIRGERKDSTTWLRCKMFGTAAEYAAESLPKGTRVMIMGKMRQEDWTTGEGEKRSVMTVFVDEIGPSLRFAQAKVTRVPRAEGEQPQRGGYNGGGNSNSGGGRSPDFGGGARGGAGAEDPWASSSSGSSGAADGFTGGASNDPFGDDNPFGN